MKNILYLVVIVLVAVGAISTGAQGVSTASSAAWKALTRGDSQGAMGILDKEIADGKNLFENYKMREFLRSANGNNAGAFDDVNKALAINAADGFLYLRRAEIGATLGKERTGILKDLDMAISYGVKNERAYQARGSILTDMGDVDGGIAAYKTALGFRPDYALGILGLSSAYRKKKDDDTAVKILEDFLASIENAEKKTHGIKRVVGGVETFETPATDGSGETQQSALLASGKPFITPPTAEENERNSDREEQTRNIIAAYDKLAGLYEQRRELDKALLTADKGIKLNSNDFYGLGIRGIIKLDLADFNGAVADFDRAIRITPKNASLYLNRGIAYMLLEKQPEAQRDFDKYLELKPDGKAFLDKQIDYAKKLFIKVIND